MQAFWDECLRRLEEELPPQQFKTWIKPLSVQALDTDNRRVEIAAPNRVKLDWARSQFAGRLSELANELLAGPAEVRFVLAGAIVRPTSTAAAAAQAAPAASPPPAPQRPAVAAPAVVTTRRGGSDDDIVDPDAHEMPAPAGLHSPADHHDPSPAHERSRLNPDLIFDNLVTGKANQLARAAANQVAENPGVSYNPLFLYGSTGLGKTHLIHAIGNAVLANSPGARVRYVHANQYANDVVKAYQRKSFDEFKAYYQSLDMLLIDDIQFLANKTRTQEEFFYAFEALVAARKQIIITSDTYPKELTNIEDRLKSRFESGLTVAIEPPELEMRVAILIKKADLEGVDISEEVAFFIAKHLRSNVRELEGALRKVLAYSSFHGRQVTVEVAKDALRDLLAVRSGQITVENIQKTVADYYKIKVADMYSKRRPTNIAKPRQIAMYLAKELTQKSLPEIGELFGGRDHTTVLHAVRKIANDRQNDTELNHALHVLEQTLKS
ncbi:chromosomal replication initiator protein DnaA [Derxia lacustris]|uniref:chromosomal replication initiator protein DnaA n=1 Tax=Derxia lacustris TaxID=764842 RepID=UPI000A1761B6|nr:chromosomal replication initiator protein DnaA [Derxia lacustris]